MKCLVIGYGSIGRRHARVLEGMGHPVGLVTRSEPSGAPVFRSVHEAVERFDPGYVVVANETRLHGATLEALAAAGYRGVTMMEKPCLAVSGDARGRPPGPVYVGYVLRFHPLMARLRDILGDRPLSTLSAYAGQYLPDWRPGSDYRRSYSARGADGGVLRDLRHELDYAQMLAGPWRRTVAGGGRLGDLEIESEDAASVVAVCERCPLVTVHLNYLDRAVTRRMIANGGFGTLDADLVAGTLAVNGRADTFAVDRDAMFRDQHAAAMSGGDPRLCTWESAMTTLRWIEAAHVSMRERRWVDARPAGGLAVGIEGGP